MQLPRLASRMIDAVPVEHTIGRVRVLLDLKNHQARADRVDPSAGQEHRIATFDRQAMEVQIGKLNDGLKQAAKAEEAIGRIEKITQETDAQLDTAAKARQQAERETAKLTKDAGALLDAVRAQVEMLSRVVEGPVNGA